MPTRRDRANAIRALAMDAVQRAASGHPGAPMGMADLAEVLWRDHLRHDLADPLWFDRDRFGRHCKFSDFWRKCAKFLTELPGAARPSFLRMEIVAASLIKERKNVLS